MSIKLRNWLSNQLLITVHYLLLPPLIAYLILQTFYDVHTDWLSPHLTAAYCTLFIKFVLNSSNIKRYIIRFPN